MRDSTFDFGSFLGRIRANAGTIATNALIAGGLAFGITFLMPSWYRSSVILLPPEETDQISTGLSVQRFLSRMPNLGMIPNYYTPSDIDRAILMSHTVQSAIARRFDLQKLYREKSAERSIVQLKKHAQSALNPDGTITLSVEDHSADRAAKMANAFVEELDRFNIDRRNVQARRTREFFEGRLALADSAARTSETALRKYQEIHHVVAPSDASISGVAPLADLMARREALEVRLTVLRSFSNENNENVVQLRAELESLNRQISAIPAVENELARLTRDVRLYQQLYALLSAQLEDARLRETMDVPTITVLDEGIPSEKRARPVRRLWALGGAVAAAILTVLWLERDSVRQPRATATGWVADEEGLEPKLMPASHQKRVK